MPNHYNHVESTPVPTEEKAWWATGLNWMFHKRAKSPALLEGDKLLPGCPVCSLATALSELS